MWSYEKRLQYPVKIKNPDPAMAKIIITQLGGPDGELGASQRYISQRYAMPIKEVKGILERSFFLLTFSPLSVKISL